MNVIFDNIHIKQTILSHLQQATQSIEIAMAWFTDTDLAAALHAATRQSGISETAFKTYTEALKGFGIMGLDDYSVVLVKF